VNERGFKSGRGSSAHDVVTPPELELDPPPSPPLPPTPLDDELLDVAGGVGSSEQANGKMAAMATAGASIEMRML